MKSILVIGATSTIAVATARLWASQGDRLYLIARDLHRLQTTAKDLQVRGAKAVQFRQLDANDIHLHSQVLSEALATMGQFDIVLIAYGSLGDQKAAEGDFSVAQNELNTNLLSIISLLTLLANVLEVRRQGTIAVISSVAGERGRQSNYIYGTAKGAISIFLQGLRNRLHKANVSVLTIKPGFVDTRMTGHLPKGILWSTPERVANAIVAAIDHKRNIIYTPWYWLPIMFTIKLIPEQIFKRLSL